MNKTKIVRSWAGTLIKLGIAIALGALSVVMFATIVSGAISAGFAALPGLGAVIMLYSAVSGSGVSQCPGCGAALTSLSTGANDGVCCDACRRYVEGKQGELWLTDPGRVADRPLFTTKLGDTFAWPPGCCVCGQPATREIKIEGRRPAPAKNAAIGVASGGTVLATGGGTTVTIEVPHCAQHDDGADIPAATGNDPVRIRFRSYPYLRAFCERNSSQPE